VLSAKRVLKDLFSKDPKAENSRDSVNLRDDLPESLFGTLSEQAILEEICFQIEEGRRNI
jgi:hypothetical protein